MVGPLDTIDREDFSECIGHPFLGAIHVMFASLPYLSKSRFARIVNIASFGGRVAVPHLSPYRVSKFALIGLSLRKIQDREGAFPCHLRRVSKGS